MTDKSEILSVVQAAKEAALTGDEAKRAANTLLSQGAQFGDLVFEGIRFRNGRITFFDRHIQRLYAGTGELGLLLPNEGLVRKVVARTVKASGIDEGYIRLLAIRPWTGWDISCPERDARVVCGVGRLILHRSTKKRPGISLCIASTRKAPREVLDGSLKWGGNYANCKRAKMEAKARGFDDAIMLTMHQIISEATVANLFWVRNGQLFTPIVSAETNCLPGITRRVVLELAKAEGIPVAEGTFNSGDLSGVDEMFLTGTGAGIVAVRQLEDGIIAEGMEGEITIRLRDAYLSRCASNGTPVDAVLQSVTD